MSEIDFGEIIECSCRFLRTEEDDKDGAPWEVAVARKYYSMLFKEYAIIDLSRYKVRLCL